MPIRPENKARYPKDWRKISIEVRERAGWQCEGSPGFYPDCRALNSHPHPVTNSLVVLTVAHLDHVPENVGEPGNRPNLVAMCQRCHLTYDADHHRETAARTRREASPQVDLIDALEPR